ncbi:MAG: hypothetical protein HY238_19775 [Acidobacteria bacterium]|nr:hypothetical protein [Acidobacteriota bacterium]
MNDVNRSQVLVDLQDVNGHTVTDEVEITFFNQQVKSLSQRFNVSFRGAPVPLTGVPAFPTGLAEVLIKPRTYRLKSIFLNNPADGSGRIVETFFVDSDEVRPVFPGFSDIQTLPQWAALQQVLQRSQIASEAAWNELGDEPRAGLLNLHAKMQRETADGVNPVFGFVDRITRFLPARIFAFTPRTLRDLVRVNSKGFHSVSGALHGFEGTNVQVVDPDGSFKTHDAAGNLQLTFGEDPQGEFAAQGRYLVDVDIDDHQGIEHAADVLQHTITGKDTNPYDIHEILIFFQRVDPGYQLVPKAAV